MTVGKSKITWKIYNFKLWLKSTVPEFFGGHRSSASIFFKMWPLILMVKFDLVGQCETLKWILQIFFEKEDFEKRFQNCFRALSYYSMLLPVQASPRVIPSQHSSLVLLPYLALVSAAQQSSLQFSALPAIYNVNYILLGGLLMRADKS